MKPKPKPKSNQNWNWKWNKGIVQIEGVLFALIDQLLIHPVALNVRVSVNESQKELICEFYKASSE